jgi:hypothetical protein
MFRKLIKVETLDDVRENLYEFLKIREDKQYYAFTSHFPPLTCFPHWYYFPDEKAFAPRRFLRWKGTTLRNYCSASGYKSDIINQLFVKVKTNSKKFNQLYAELCKFLRDIDPSIVKLGKIKNERYGGIWVLNDEFINKHIAGNLPKNKREKTDNNDYFEGSKYEVISTRSDRNREAREECIKQYGAKCVICGFSFREKYKGIGDGFIHVHHKVPLANRKKEYRVVPLKHLRPVCPNCHAVIHSKSIPYEIEEVKKMIKKK